MDGRLREASTELVEGGKTKICLPTSRHTDAFPGLAAGGALPGISGSAAGGETVGVQVPQATFGMAAPSWLTGKRSLATA